MEIDLKELFEFQDSNHDSQVVQKILEKVKEGAQDGFDYLKFRYSLINLLKMNMDTPTSIKSAFTTASTMGLDKDKLLQSLAYYENLVYEQKEAFTAALKNQILKQVDGPAAELEKLDSMREENLRKIESLKAEIDGIENRKASLKSEIEVSQSKIETTRGEFKAVTDHLDSIINSDKSLFNELL